MGSFLVLVESVTVISNPAEFAKQAGVAKAVLELLPTGHYLELDTSPPQTPAPYQTAGLNAAYQRGLRRRQRTRRQPRHRVVVRLARPSLPRGGRGWPLSAESAPDSLEGQIAVAKASEAGDEKVSTPKAETDHDESEVYW